MNKKVATPGSENRLTDVGTRCANHVTPLYPQKLALTSLIGGGRSVGMVRSRTKATEFYRNAVGVSDFLYYRQTDSTRSTVLSKAEEILRTVLLKLVIFLSLIYTLISKYICS